MTTLEAAQVLAKAFIEDPEGAANTMWDALPDTVQKQLAESFFEKLGRPELEEVVLLGNAEAHLEICEKASRISIGFSAMGDAATAEAFAKFAGKLRDIAKSRGERVAKATQDRMRTRAAGEPN